MTPTLIIDGECALCSALARFVRRRRRGGAVDLVGQLSDEGRSLLARHGRLEDARDSVVLIEGDRSWIRSSAVLRLLRRLGLPWSILAAFALIPRPLRDAAYDVVARHRRRISAACDLPRPSEPRVKNGGDERRPR